MNLVKWIRKNQMKLMAVVVILIMVSFVGGTALQQILSRLGRTGGSAAASYGQDKKITHADITEASNELTALRMLHGDMFLQYRMTVDGRPDMNSMILSYLLFGQSQSPEALYAELRQGMMQGHLRASVKDIDGFFSGGGVPSEIFWLLLKAEARQAGCAVSDDEAKRAIKTFLEQLLQGQGTAGDIIQMVIENQRMTEEQIIRTFADMLSILAYSEMVVENESVTTNQIRSILGHFEEKIDAEYVRVDSAGFAGAQPEPAQEQIEEHFGKYKEILPGRISEDNLYGFGYKLPVRVEIEYVIAKVADIRGQIPETTNDEIDNYYRRNIQIFTDDIPVDPNEPEGAKVAVTRPRSEVTSQIKRQILEEKTARRADMIMNEVKNLTEKGFAEIDFETAESDDLAKAAGSYTDAAKAVGEKYGLTLQAGKTGMLKTEDITADKYLGRMSVEGGSLGAAPLWRIVMSVEEASAVELSRFEGSRRKMWENIGPVRDSGRTVIALVRVMAAEKEAVPADIDVSFGTAGVTLDEVQNQQKDKVFSVKEQVINDCKILGAMQQAKAKAHALAGLVKEKGWEAGLEEFNKAQPQEDSENSRKYELEKITSQARQTFEDIRNLEDRFGSTPMGIAYYQSSLAEKMRLDLFYSQIPQGQTALADTAVVLDFAPEQAYYVLKSISFAPAQKQRYELLKKSVAYQVSALEAEGLSLVHFKPDNILKRMNYKSEKTTPQERQLSPEEMLMRDEGDI